MVLYLERFSFPNEETEWNVCSAEKHTCYDSFYPFGVLGEKELGRVSFEPVSYTHLPRGSAGRIVYKFYSVFSGHCQEDSQNIFKAPRRGAAPSFLLKFFCAGVRVFSVCAWCFAPSCGKINYCRGFLGGKPPV